MKKRTKQEIYFAVCINNKGYEASLEVGKLYRILPDEKAESHGYLRVVDESGDDYGYSARLSKNYQRSITLRRSSFNVSSLPDISMLAWAAKMKRLPRDSTPGTLLRASSGE